ncbi:MAG: DUF3800 domain-containing protein [Clostridia bacterium]|nr:DUF3800 domain-containing protein [Clostridia bacterium]
MDTYIAYFDESGDDGISTASSSYFVLTSMYMSAESWQSNYNKIKAFRASLKKSHGFHASEEMHTKHLLSNKEPYRKYGWTNQQRQDIIKYFTLCLAELDVKFINTIIDKTKITTSDYHVLENALKYNIQRIENDSAGKWNYIIITDQGRIAPMRKTARAIRAYNPIQSKYSLDFKNEPINNLIEDILEKDSKESYFVQMCDFVSYIVHLYYRTQYKKQPLPNRVGQVVDEKFIGRVMATLKNSGKLNTKASSRSTYGLVIYPR